MRSNEQGKQTWIKSGMFTISTGTWSDIGLVILELKSICGLTGSSTDVAEGVLEC
jgi:hypothetical protein